MTDELKPCPFCGSNNGVVLDSPEYVACMVCGFEGVAIRDYNRRPIEDELRAEIGRLRSEKDALRKVVIGMFPMWINAMGYCEHGNRKQLDAMYSYYRGAENPMTNEDLKLMFSIIPEKAKGGE